MTTATEGFFVFSCGSCGTKLRTRPSADGRTAKCPRCGTRFKIDLSTAVAPADGAAMPAPAPPPEASPPPAASTAPAPTAAVPAAPAPEPSLPAASATVTSWAKVIILMLAVAVIGAFAWYLVVRFGGERAWIVKRSIAAWVIGMASAGVMAGAGRRGAAGRIASALAAIVAIALGQMLAVVLIELPPDAAPAPLLARAFDVVDPLFYALAVAGSTALFLLAPSQ